MRITGFRHGHNGTFTSAAVDGATVSLNLRFERPAVWIYSAEFRKVGRELRVETIDTEGG